MKITSIITISMGCAAALTLGGCAGYYGGTSSDARYHFAQEVPAGISSAWREGGKVWIVPTKNTMLDQASDASGKPVEIVASGSYLNIDSPSSVFKIRIDSSYFVALHVPVK